MSPSKPHISVREAVRITRELYGLEGEAIRLPGEMDANFRLTTAEGKHYVLKIMHETREQALIDLQCHALDYLAVHVPELSLPRVIPTAEGAPYARVQTELGKPHWVWLLSHVPGRLLAHVKPQSPELLHSLGRFLGKLDRALAGFHHEAARRVLKWDLAQAAWINEHLSAIAEASHRDLVASFMQQYESEVTPRLSSLRRSIIHNDANDYNVLVTDARSPQREVVGIIDFGDLVLTNTICELAIAAAYALLKKEEPLVAAAQVVAGYHSVHHLEETEIRLLYPLICTRLCVSVVNSALRKRQVPDDPYVTISEADAWRALEKLAEIHPRLAHYTFRQACGLPPTPSEEAVTTWLRAHAHACAPLLDQDPRSGACHVFDLSVGSLALGADPAILEPSALAAYVSQTLRRKEVSLGIGRYNEARLAVAADVEGTCHPTAEQPTIHLGIDLFVTAGSAVHAPLAGTLLARGKRGSATMAGHWLILRHVTGEGDPFYTLYDHLDALTKKPHGSVIARGEAIGRITPEAVEGESAKHLHFQLALDLLDMTAAFPHRACPAQAALWRSLSPDPNLILGIPVSVFPPTLPTKAQTLRLRQARLGRNLSISYNNPLKIVRGWMQYLYDDGGRAYLDLYNNVAHVGHSHPHVVRAIQEQVALLNTNTRYLHDNITRYAERLCATLPEPLRVCFFVNSATEANELALRLARTYTGHDDMIVLDAAYHGHTTTLIDISPYKSKGPGGQGLKPWVHVAPLPDDYRGPYKRHDPEAGVKYARHVAELISALRRQGRGIAGYIAESLPSVGGQIVFPSGYLAEVYRFVRAAGGVCIADEVQVGLGRLGAHFWGFEAQAVVPDIVVAGKPIGNGHPLAAVITTPALADAFANGMEFFSTFGGNPVSCAAGLAVLDVLVEENLQEHALQVGSRLKLGLQALQTRHPIIGDVRGSGLFLGIELVRDPTTLEPADWEAAYVVERLREHGILTGVDGPYHNVLKMRGPMVIQSHDVDFFLETLDRILAEDPLQV